MITMLTETPATNQLTGEKYFFSLHPDFVLTLHHVSERYFVSFHHLNIRLQSGSGCDPTLKLNPLN